MSADGQAQLKVKSRLAQGHVQVKFRSRSGLCHIKAISCHVKFHVRSGHVR